MKLIAHRGNIDGKIPERENDPRYLREAMEAGYDVETDLWVVNDELFLGHNEPQFSLGMPQSDMWFNFLFKYNNSMWLHCKNLEALGKLYLYSDLNLFWHDKDDVILTTKRWLWTFPNKPLWPGSICVLPERGINGDIEKCWGICSDFPAKYQYLNKK